MMLSRRGALGMATLLGLVGRAAPAPSIPLPATMTLHSGALSAAELNEMQIAAVHRMDIALPFHPAATLTAGCDVQRSGFAIELSDRCAAPAGWNTLENVR